MSEFVLWTPLFSFVIFILFFAIGGPPVALYLLPATNEKIPYIATANAYFFLFKVFRCSRVP